MTSLIRLERRRTLYMTLRELDVHTDQHHEEGRQHDRVVLEVDPELLHDERGAPGRKTRQDNGSRVWWHEGDLTHHDLRLRHCKHLRRPVCYPAGTREEARRARGRLARATGHSLPLWSV